MRPRGILLFFATIIATLSAISFILPDSGISVRKLHLRYPTLHMLVAVDSSCLSAAEPSSADLVSITDSVAHYRRLVNDGELRFWLPNSHYFDALWAKMEQARSRKRTVRVLHYGDSQIEMDHITSRLRANLQATFGGGGPGMLPFQTVTPTFTVRQSTHGSLVHLASFGDSLAVRSKGNYGPMMQCFRLSGGDATVTIKAAKSNRVDSCARRFNRVQLIYNNRGPFRYEFSNIKNKKEAYTGTAQQQGVKHARWQTDSTTDGLKIHVSGDADLYALLVDADSGGVAVDNIPMRGCSGQQFTQVNTDLLTAAYATMDIGLIILQFGGNSVPYLNNSKQIAAYCKSLGKQIDHIHNCCPEAKILFIGPSDMSKRIGGELQTYPIIPELIDSLIATANTHNAAYWSIYHAMGGRNSMPVWARQGLAGNDYIHFSQKGADLMGERLSEAFANSYSLYRLERLTTRQSARHSSHSKSRKSRKRGSR